MARTDLPRLLLVDRSPTLVAAWARRFDDCEDVEVVQGDFFERPAHAMVSPANSFGIMDGGLDLAIRDTLGFQVQDAVRRVILETHHGEMPVGAAEVVATSHASWPFLVVAPTMRVPENVARTTHAYLAFRAALLAVVRFRRAHDTRIDSLVCPGLGTGIGGMDPDRCATQMFLAYRHVRDPARIPSFAQIHALHDALMRA
ncbi:MAG: macro domain-containing protein [Polyangiales bacterium]